MPPLLNLLTNHWGSSKPWGGSGGPWSTRSSPELETSPIIERVWPFCRLCAAGERAGRHATMNPYLLGLRLQGRRVVVVGGGAVASRRVPALLQAGADALLVSPKVTASLEDLAAAGRIRWEPREYARGDCSGAWLVCACADSQGVNAAVAAEAEEQRTWCVRADDAQASPAWTPAAGEAGDVRVGVLSGDPRHSAAIRDAIVAGVRSGQL